MSWSLLRPADLLTLAWRGKRLRESVSLDELPRLVEALPFGADDAKRVVCDLAIRHDSGDQVTASGTVATSWRLRCQRCLGEMDYVVKIDFCWQFRRDDTAGFLLSEEPVRLADYIEDELLLELPQIPTHANETDCETLSGCLASEPATADAQNMRRPFAGLRDLLSGEGH